VVAESVLAEFLPASIDVAGGIRLVRTGPPPFPEAFVFQTVEALTDDAPVATLDASQLAGLQPSWVPPGMVVHCGHAGSTLLCRALEAAAPVATFREPDVLGDVHELQPTQRRAAQDVAVLGQFAWMAAAAGRRAVVKLPSHAAGLVAELPPEIPVLTVGLLRDPVRVVERFLAAPPLWLLDELAVDGRHPFPATSADLPRGPFVARHLANRWTAVVDAVDALDPAAVVAYDDLVERPAPTVRRVVSHLEIGADDGPAFDRAVVAVARSDAKSGRPWSGDVTPAPLTEEERSAVDEATAASRGRAEELCGRELAR
jgi:hypothetical protein